MKKYLAPLGIFVGGQLLLLVVFLLMPAIGQTTDQLATDTAALAPTFWGWAWVVSSARLWVWLAFEGALIFATFKAFLAVKD